MGLPRNWSQRPKALSARLPLKTSPVSRNAQSTRFGRPNGVDTGIGGSINFARVLRTKHGWQGCLLRRSIRATRAGSARSRCVGIVIHGTGLIKRIFVASHVGTRRPPTITPRRIFVIGLPSTSLWCPPFGVRRKPRRFSPGYLTAGLTASLSP